MSSGVVQAKRPGLQSRPRGPLLPGRGDPGRQSPPFPDIPGYLEQESRRGAERKERGLRKVAAALEKDGFALSLSRCAGSDADPLPARLCGIGVPPMLRGRDAHATGSRLLTHPLRELCGAGARRPRWRRCRRAGSCLEPGRRWTESREPECDSSQCRHRRR